MLFRHICEHDYKVVQRSNAIQLDDMGYPLRLFLCECTKCGKSIQQWIDVDERALDEIRCGISVLVKWY